MDLSTTSPTRVRLLGAHLDIVTPDDVMHFTSQCIRSRRKAIVANHNAHSLALMRRDGIMRVLYAMADIIEIDSMPLIAWGRALGVPVASQHRCTYLDWRENFWRLAQTNGWRVFYLGGEPGIAEQAARNIRARWDGVTIGVHHGFFDHDERRAENREVIDTINAFAPDVLLVGLGMPRQERWIALNYEKIQQGVLFSVGGAFDYEAGAQPTPPRWTGALGVEWLYRFCTQPRRLFTRYFIEPWALARPALGDLRRALRTSRTKRPARISSPFTSSRPAKPWAPHRHHLTRP